MARAKRMTARAVRSKWRLSTSRARESTPIWIINVVSSFRFLASSDATDRRRVQGQRRGQSAGERNGAGCPWSGPLAEAHGKWRRLSTGWDSVRPTSGRAGQMGLFGAPVASESLQGIYVIGPAASVAVETHEHAPEAPSGEVLTCVRLRRHEGGRPSVDVRRWRGWSPRRTVLSGCHPRVGSPDR